MLCCSRAGTILLLKIVRNLFASGATRYAALVQTSRLLLIAAQILLALIYTLPVFSPQLIKDSDYVAFFTGWSILRDGQGSTLYDLDQQVKYQKQIVGTDGPALPYRLLPFINPPHAALLFMPLAYLSFTAAAYVFLVINALVAVWIARRLWQFAAAWSETSRLLLISTFLTTEVFWYGLATRTMTLIVMAALIEYFLALRRQQYTRAAIWLLVGSFKPQLVLLPALIPLAQRRWRLIAVAASLGLLIALGISAYLGFGIWREYFRTLREVSLHGQQYGANVLLMNNLHMLFERGLWPAAVTPAVYFALACGIVGTLLMWRSTDQFDLRFAITILLGILVAPHLNYQDTILIFLPAAIAYEHARRPQLRIENVFGLGILVYTFLPPLLIFSGSRVLRWTWPVVSIVALTAICTSVLIKTKPAVPDPCR